MDDRRRAGEVSGGGGRPGAAEGTPVAASAPVPASVDGVVCDAREATVPAYDDGLLRGDGAFEFVRCYAGRPFAFEEHLDRLSRSCATLRLACPRAQVEAEVAALLDSAGPVFADMRIVLTRGGRRLVFLEPSAAPSSVRLAFIGDVPRLILAGTKSLSYAGNMLARRLARERGFDEALLTTPDGRVLEVQQAAFFWVTPQGDLCTPPLSEGILDSITRRVVMRHLDVSERVCGTEDALGAAEAFAAGTAREIQPVAAIEDRLFGDAPGPVTRRAAAAFHREVERRLGLTASQRRGGR